MELAQLSIDLMLLPQQRISIQVTVSLQDRSHFVKLVHRVLTSQLLLVVCPEYALVVVVSLQHAIIIRVVYRVEMAQLDQRRIIPSVDVVRYVALVIRRLVGLGPYHV